MTGLVLSLFPGIGLLDRAFEEEGFCVVRGPDLLWGGDVRCFHPPAGRFDGVIGGPPCQAFSGLANFAHRWKHPPEDLIPQFERVCQESAPDWFLMENVPLAPVPAVDGLGVHSCLLNSRQFGMAQNRERRFSFGSRFGLRLDKYVASEVSASPINGDWDRAVTASHGGGRYCMKGTIESLSVEEALRRQGLPEDFFGDRSPFTRKAALKMIAQGVPLPMGRAVAKAVMAAMYGPEGFGGVA